MALKANKIRLGIFFVLIMGLFIISILWLAGGLDNRASTDYACYFGWSVGGLNVGNSVVYNGVPVGQVTDIEIAPDGRLVKVVLRLEDEKFRVDDTIVAALYITGITGNRNVNLESMPDSAVRFWSADQLSFESDLPVIPVQTGTMQAVTSGLNRIFEVLDQIDVKTLNDEIIHALSRMNDLLDRVMESDSLDYKVDCLLDRMDTLIVTYNRLGLELTVAVREIRGDIDPIMHDTQEFVRDLNELMTVLDNLSRDLGETLGDAGVILREFSILMPRINRILDGLSAGSSGEDIWR